MGDLTNVAREVHNKVSELNNKTGEITFGSQVFTQPAHQKPPVTQVVCVCVCVCVYVCSVCVCVCVCVCACG